MFKLNRISKIRLAFLDNKNGFTIVEMVVVMSIIAMLFTLMAFGLMGAGKQVRLQDAAKTFQSNIRQAANNSITVSPDINNQSIPAKAWAVRARCQTPSNSYDLYDFHSPVDVGGGLFNLENSYKEIKLEGNIEIYIDANCGASPENNGFLVFSSPFAKFTSKKNNITGDTHPWQKVGTAEEMIPDGSSISGSITVYIQDKDSKIPIIINGDTGETSVSGMVPR